MNFLEMREDEEFCMRSIHLKLFIYFLVTSLMVTFTMGKSFSQENVGQEATLEIQGADGSVQEVKASDLDKASDELAKEAQSEQDPKKRNLLQKLSLEFKKMSQGAKELFKKKEGKKKKKINIKTIGRAVGKGATFVSTQTARPFINAAGFLTGFFEKPEKNEEAVAFLNFILNHDEDLKDVYKEASTPEDYLNKLQAKIDEILVLKSAIILQDTLATLGQPVAIGCVLKTLGVEPYATDTSISDLEHVVDMLAINAEEIKPELINEHPEFQELKPLVGELNQEQTMDLLLNGSLELDVDGDAILNGSRIKLGEAVGAYAGQLFLPKMVTGIVSKSLGGIVGATTLVADLGFAASASMCLAHKKTKEKVGVDPEVTEFCSYIVNKSAYVLSRSRAKGYVAGKKFKVKAKRFFNEKLGFGKKNKKEKKEVEVKPEMNNSLM